MVLRVTPAGTQGSLLKEVSIRLLSPFFDGLSCFLLLLLSLMTALFILDISPLSDVWYVTIFYNSLQCLFFGQDSFAI